MNIALSYPWVAALLPLAILPLLFAVQRRQGYPSLAAVEVDPLSRAVDIGLHVIGAAAIIALLAGLAGIHLKGQTVERVGEGSHIVLLLDRSSSMDETFAGKTPAADEASKSAAARELLRDFITRRPHDRFGVAAFSTMPMHVLPITSNKDAVLGAVDAIVRPGLAFTNVGLGLAMALSMHDADPTAASRAILLVSDGAAVIDRRVQERLRAQIAKRPVNLYWLYLRTAGAPGIFDPPGEDVPDTPQALPERHLNLFFQTLKVPYKAFEAEDPKAVAEAITEIDKLERNPIRYQERIPEQDLSSIAYAIAAAGPAGKARRGAARFRSRCARDKTGEAASAGECDAPSAGGCLTMNRWLHEGLAALGGAKAVLLTAVLAVSALIFAISGWLYVDKLQTNTAIDKLRTGTNVDVDATRGSAPLLEARAAFLLRRNRFEEAQPYLDQAELRADPAIYARMLYNMANARMRGAVRSIEKGDFDKAIPLVALAKSEYRSALRIDPEDWNSKYNLDVAMRLVRDLPQAVGEDEEKALETPEKLWTDLPGTPQGLP